MSADQHPTGSSARGPRWVIAGMLVAELPFVFLGPVAVWALFAREQSFSAAAAWAAVGPQLLKTAGAALLLHRFLRPVEGWRRSLPASSERRELVAAAATRAQRAPMVIGGAWSGMWLVALLIQSFVTAGLSGEVTSREALAAVLSSAGGAAGAAAYLAILLSRLLQPLTTELSDEAARLGASKERRAPSLQVMLLTLALCMSVGPTVWMAGLAVVAGAAPLTIALFSGPTFLWAPLVAWWLARFFGDAFGRLGDHVARVARQGEIGALSATPAVPIDELQNLSDSIGGMLQRLKSAEDARKEGLAKVEGLYLAASDAVQARDDFLSIAGHELKTPLTALRLNLHTTTRDDALPPPLEKRLASAIQLTNRLGRLIDELLDVSRAQAGRLPIERERISLTSVVAEVVERMTDEAQRAGAPIQVLADEELEGEWDRTRLEQVVENLLSNALKYGARHPVEVELHRRDGCAHIEVRDHGIGIPLEEQARVFQKFERVLADSRVGGLGLGLWISRQIVEAHGGAISVESRPGQGSTFLVKLPLHR